MASQSETGHAKNLANFKELISIVKSLGEKYQPSAEALKVASLETLATQAEQLINKLKEAETLAKQATASLQDTFKTLNTLSSQIMGMLSSSGAKSNSIEEARSIQKRITGGNKKSKTDNTNSQDSEEAKAKRSQSRQSYDSRLDEFEKLIIVLQNISEYNPNEELLKISSLQNKVVEMKNAIQTTDDKNMIRSQAMAERDKILYAPESGMVEIALKVRAYIKAAFGGVKSMEYKRVSKIEVKTLKK